MGMSRRLKEESNGDWGGAYGNKIMGREFGLE